jgi:hypothetical protein
MLGNTHPAHSNAASKVLIIIILAASRVDPDMNAGMPAFGCVVDAAGMTFSIVRGCKRSFKRMGGSNRARAATRHRKRIAAWNA